VSDGPPPFTRVASQLSTSSWTYAALGTLIETGLLERIEEARTPLQLAAEGQLDVLLVEALLDVGLALGLVSRGQDGYRVNGDVLSGLQSPAGRAQRLFIRSDFLQTTDLLQRARAGTLKPGWYYTDPDILNAQGIGSGAVMETLCRDVVPTLDGLVDRLSAPGAEFLDVGAGVGGICIALARVWPNLRVVGLEPAPAPLHEAEGNVSASGFAERIELLQIRLDQLADEGRFDGGWLPQVFLPLEVLELSLGPFYRSLKPGGWGILFALSSEGDEVGPTISRLRNVLWGGQPHAPSVVGNLMANVGFRDIRVEAAGGIAGASLIIGRKPAPS
jgi:SAM-dependent methyltransferase